MNPKDLVGKTIASVESTRRWCTLVTFTDGTSAEVLADWDYSDNGDVKIELRWKDGDE